MNNRLQAKVAQAFSGRQTSQSTKPLGLVKRIEKSGVTTILDERANIHAEFERTGRLGFVPAEALIVRLYTNHRDELAEDKRQLDALEQTLEAHFRKLDTLFPAPVPPPPETPLPPPVRTFGRLSETWSQPHAYTRH